MDVRYCFQRYEKKYMLDPGQMETLLSGMEGRIRPDAFGRYTVCNIYYDTQDLRLIRTSLKRPVYKEKLRMRSYGVPGDRDQVFVELKKKYDGIVYKRRTAMAAADAVSYIHDGAVPEHEDQICREIGWSLHSYRLGPKVFIAYDRTAFTGRTDPELRITFDAGLRWRDTALDLRAGDSGAPLLPPERILMEIKLPGAAPVWLARLLSENGIFPASCSKYGTCYREHLMHQIPLMQDGEGGLGFA